MWGKESMLQIYHCQILNEENPTYQYEEIFKNDIFMQIEVFKRIKHAIQKGSEYKKLFEDSMWSCDPLFL